MCWLGDSRDRLRRFPDAARRDAGYQLSLIQAGRPAKDWNDATRRARRDRGANSFGEGVQGLLPGEVLGSRLRVARLRQEEPEVILARHRIGQEALS